MTVPTDPGPEKRSPRRRTLMARVITVVLAPGLAAPAVANAAPGPFYYIVSVNSGRPIMPIGHSKSSWTRVWTAIEDQLRGDLTDDLVATVPAGQMR